MLGLFQARGERRLTRTRGIWILRTPFINQPSAHLDQIYALSGTLVIGDGPSQLFLELCAIVYVLVYIQFFVCKRVHASSEVLAYASRTCGDTGR